MERETEKMKEKNNKLPDKNKKEILQREKKIKVTTNITMYVRTYLPRIL